MVRSIKLALQFLTVSRVRVEPPGDLAEVGRSSWAFPVVGAYMGVILCVAQLVFRTYMAPSVTAILVVGLWIFLSGGLHLDGWTDCWDALAASVPPERRVQILKDSRLGTFGALALFILVALKIAAVGSGRISPEVLFAAPVAGRTVMVIAAYGVRHRGSGMAAMYLSGLDRDCVLGALALGTVGVAVAGWTGIIAAVAGYVASWLFRRLAEARLQAVNGDVLGAMCELCETTFLVIACGKW